MTDTVRARQYMMTQDLGHLGYNLDDLEKYIVKVNPEEWAYILHDKDKDEAGEAIRPHVHAVLKFKNPQTLDRLAKALKIQPQYLEVWSGRINNAYSYMLHLTTGAKEKHIYSSKEVRASFDFAKRIEEITNTISKKAVTEALTMYSNGGLTQDELRTKIGNLNYAKQEDTIRKVTRVLDDKIHQEWLEEFSGKKMQVQWLYGKSGTGKTRIAVNSARKDGRPYCVLGSSNDFFQDYQAKFRVVILDELRPNDLKYSDLLRILDPYQHDKRAPRRYRNVALNIERLLVTSPYSPRKFYDKTKISDRDVDTYEQLKRRLDKVIEVTPEVAKEMLSDEK